MTSPYITDMRSISAPSAHNAHFFLHPSGSVPVASPNMLKALQMQGFSSFSYPPFLRFSPSSFFLGITVFGWITSGLLLKTGTKKARFYRAHSRGRENRIVPFGTLKAAKYGYFSHFLSFHFNGIGTLLAPL